MKAPLLAALLALLPLGARTFANEAEDLAKIDGIEKTLKRIVIPKIEFQKTPLPEVLDFISQKLREQDKRGAGIPIVIDRGPWEFEPTPGIFGPPAPPSNNDRISIFLKNPSLHHALEFAARLSGRKLSIHPDRIHVIPYEDYGLFFTREFRIPPQFFRKAFEKLDRAERDRFIQENVSLYLRAIDVWDLGPRLAFNGSTTRFTVQETKEKLDRIEKALTPNGIAEVWDLRPYPVPGPKEPKDLCSVDDAKVRRAWRGVILPQISFENASVKEVVDTFNRFHVAESMDEYDTALVYRDPHLKAPDIPGIPGFPDSSEAPPPPPAEEPKITYVAANISAWDALQAIAQRADLELLTSPYVRFEPAGILSVRSYLVPPNAWPQPSAEASIDDPGSRKAAGDWLTGGGVTIPKGAFLSFEFQKRKLSTANTVAEHRKIATMVDEAWRAYYAAQKAKKGRARPLGPKS